MQIHEHSGISMIDLSYNITSLEFVSIWNGVLKKQEIINEQIEEQNKKNQ